MIALIMLIMMTLIVITSFNIGSTNLQIVSNAQEQQRATIIAEQLLGEKLNAINSGLTSDPCDITAITAADGSLTEQRDQVNVTFSRNLIRAQCVSNSQVLTPWHTALAEVTAAQTEADAACGSTPSDPVSTECSAKLATLAEKRAKRETVFTRAVECTKKGSTGGSHVMLDPEEEEEDDDESSSSASASLPGADTEGNSYCVDVIMELRADAVDTISGAQSSIMRGIILHCSNHDIPDC